MADQVGAAALLWGVGGHYDLPTLAGAAVPYEPLAAGAGVAPRGVPALRLPGGCGHLHSVHGHDQWTIVHGPLWTIVHGPLWTIVHAWISIKLSMHGSVHVH